MIHDTIELEHIIIFIQFNAWHIVYILKHTIDITICKILQMLSMAEWQTSKNVEGGAKK